MNRIALSLAAPLVAPLVIGLAVAGCSSHASQRERPTPEAWSLSGEPLYPMELPPEERTRKEAELAQAQSALAARPEGADEIIWYGRRLAYLGRFDAAIETFSRGIDAHPTDARLFRHRGHRYITVRDFDRAVSDLQRAATLIEGRIDEVEPAGLPNARGITVDTLNQNVYYHLALAHYLRGDFERAADGFRRCLGFSKNPDSLCAATHWLYMTLRRLGRDAEAKELTTGIRADLDVVEYKSYHQLCLVYAGVLDADALLDSVAAAGAESADFATVAYGVGNWHRYNGRKERALEIFRRAARVPIWPAFGRIASEAELAREAEAPAPAPSPTP